VRRALLRPEGVRLVLGEPLWRGELRGLLLRQPSLGAPLLAGRQSRPLAQSLIGSTVRVR
jgi:hypothetical protein